MTFQRFNVMAYLCNLNASNIILPFSKKNAMKSFLQSFRVFSFLKHVFFTQKKGKNSFYNKTDISTHRKMNVKLFFRIIQEKII